MVIVGFMRHVTPDFKMRLFNVSRGWGCVAGGIHLPDEAFETAVDQVYINV